MLIILEARNAQILLCRKIDPSPLRGLLPEGWVCEYRGTFYFFPMTHGRPVPNFSYGEWSAPQFRSRPTWQGRGLNIGMLDTRDEWRNDWCNIFPELLPDQYRIVRVGPSVDGITWRPTPGVSSAMEELFPDGVLACNRRGEVMFYRQRSLPYGEITLPRSNSLQRDFDFEADDRITTLNRIPPFLRCMHFPEELDHRQRQVVVGPKIAAYKRRRAMCWGLVGRIIDFVSWAFTGIDPREVNTRDSNRRI